MTLFAERRKYQRCSSAIGKAMISMDKKTWLDIEMCDISAGGLKFVSDAAYELGAQMDIQLKVYNMMSEFEMELEGNIIRIQEERNGYAYSVKFHSMDKYKRVQLDEVIKSKISVCNSKQPMAEDGMYTFLFLPKAKAASISGKMRMFR